jgi:hypothetical protein
VRIKAPPDARFLPWGHRATLVFDALPGLASDPRADLELYWNDVLLRKAPMEPLSRARRFTLSAPIPASALRRANVLTVAWNGRSGAPGPFVALRGESSFSLPREYVAELPDLALLRHGLYPFGLRADLSDTVVGVPPGEEAFPALCELALVMGLLAPAGRSAAPHGTGRDRRQAVWMRSCSRWRSAGLPPPDLKRLPRGGTTAATPCRSRFPRRPYVLRVRADIGAARAALRSLGALDPESALGGHGIPWRRGPSVSGWGAPRRGISHPLASKRGCAVTMPFPRSWPASAACSSWPASGARTLSSCANGLRPRFRVRSAAAWQTIICRGGERRQSASPPFHGQASAVGMDDACGQRHRRAALPGSSSTRSAVPVARRVWSRGGRRGC